MKRGVNLRKKVPSPRKKGLSPGKRGLSPVVSSVLLIMLVLVMATMIFLWARGFVSEQIEKFGQPIDNLCSTVDFEAELTNINSPGGEILEVVNRGNVDIYHIEIKKWGSDGNSETGRFKFNVDAGKSAKGPISLIMSNGDRAEKITLYPALIGNVRGKPLNKVFTCNDIGKHIQIN